MLEALLGLIRLLNLTTFSSSPSSALEDCYWDVGYVLASWNSHATINEVQEFMDNYFCNWYYQLYTWEYNQCRNVSMYVPKIFNYFERSSSVDLWKYCESNRNFS